MSIFSSLFGKNRQLKKYETWMADINTAYVALGSVSEADIKQKTAEYKKRVASKQKLAAKQKEVDVLLPEAFALVKKAMELMNDRSWDVMGERFIWKLAPTVYDVQLMGAMALHDHHIAELKTGEGKTMVVEVFPAYLNALVGKGVHVVTPNSYLAERDFSIHNPIYELLGLTAGVVLHGQDFATKQAAYAADVTYGTNNEYGFDYLRDNMVASLAQRVQRGHYMAIIDEVDSILVDEARTPLIISAPDESSSQMYQQFAHLVPKLTEDTHFNVDEKDRAVTLTEEGIEKVEELLGVKDIYSEKGVSYVHHLEQALRANHLYKRDRDYLIQNSEVVIIDQFTGRTMPGRRFSEGLHQALEAKENVPVQRESKTLATITFQNYFRMYKRLAGMTGTAKTQEEEFIKVYNLPVVEVPTNKPIIREDKPDEVFKNEQGKFTAVAREVERLHKEGRPVLIGTIAVEKSERLSALLTEIGIEHEVLNAKQHEREAKIVEKAGLKGAVTIATNMAGRGTDIKLGAGVRELGGLAVIGSERHEARRIDNQLRGRSGRQGDAGSSQFFISMEDDLLRLFGSERMQAVMNTLNVPEDQPLESRVLSGQIEAAQKKIEGHNFDTRRYVLQYDNVMNRQREVMYARREHLLKDPKHTKEEILGMMEEEIERVVAIHSLGEFEARWNSEEMTEVVGTIMPLPTDAHTQVMNMRDRDGSEQQDAEARTKVVDYFMRQVGAFYDARQKELGEELMRQIEKAVLLRTIDSLWMEHIDTMDGMRQSIGLRGYGQRDPLTEYKREGFHLFELMQEAIKKQVVYTILKVNVVKAPPENALDKAHISVGGEGNEEATGKTIKNSDQENIGRNDPCWCGSGKKYKKCHGK